MNIYISPFVLGILCTIGSEIGAFILIALISGIRSYLKSRGNTSK